jgi:hypothetical protein
MRGEVSSNLPLGEIVDGFVIPPHPRGIELEGKWVMIQPLSAEKFAAELYEAYQLDPQGNNWTYLPYGPFSTQSEFLNWLRSVEDGTDPVFFAIINKTMRKAVGVASFLRINPQDGTIEVGHLNFSPLLQKTTEAAEVMFLMMNGLLKMAIAGMNGSAMLSTSSLAGQRKDWAFLTKEHLDKL